MNNEPSQQIARLTKDEQEFINNFRNLTEEEQRNLIDQVMSEPLELEFDY